MGNNIRNSFSTTIYTYITLAITIYSSHKLKSEIQSARQSEPPSSTRLKYNDDTLPSNLETSWWTDSPQYLFPSLAMQISMIFLNMLSLCIDGSFTNSSKGIHCVHIERYNPVKQFKFMEHDNNTVHGLDKFSSLKVSQ